MKKNIRIVIFILFGFVMLFFVQRWGNNRDRRFYNEFDSANINGLLMYSESGYYMRVFKTENINFKYVFDPHLSVNKKALFSKVAKKGDSIIKPANADTLVLKKNDNTIFLFTFRKYE
ncbi:MAG: hypothetical protein B7C24_17700 [Bacteroidetes bacterium 4572_77]|nr:MAG: hypothetical protein B7C24_17700 [Bacteroidetes bacterium 4572_77]